MSAISRFSGQLYESKELHSGDRMTQEEFHRIYEKMPAHVKAELIGGVVYVASPVGRLHGRSDAALITIMSLYAARTPGVEACSNTRSSSDADPSLSQTFFFASCRNMQDSHRLLQTNMSPARRSSWRRSLTAADPSTSGPNGKITAVMACGNISSCPSRTMRSFTSISPGISS